MSLIIIYREDKEKDIMTRNLAEKIKGSGHFYTPLFCPVIFNRGAVAHK
jgi:hypothetical protein